LLDEFRDQGFVTFGSCTDGIETSARVEVTGSDVGLPVTLKDALPEERTGACDPQAVAGFDAADTRLIQMHLDAESAALHRQLVSPQSRSSGALTDTKETRFVAEFSLSPAHARSPGQANLRGQSSLLTCDATRLSYSINLERGRERFLIPEAEGGVGTDKFNLISMCLDPMYLNQVSANHLLRDAELFASAYELVELRINGETQGVYLLIENVTDSLRRRYAGLESVLRRSQPPEVKFPDEEDVGANAAALAQFDALPAPWVGLSGTDRLQLASSRVDLPRFLYYVAFNALLDNADWVDEPYFAGLEGFGPNGAETSFRVYGWDADDILEGGCDHPGSVVPDPFGLLGCAEHALELGLFGTRPGGGPAVDDEAYARYVDVLEQTSQYLTEERVRSAFRRTAADLAPFAADPRIVEAMPDWRGVADVGSALDAAVVERVASYRLRRSELLGRIRAYRASH
jgi:hypothetical protein